MSGRKTLLMTIGFKDKPGREEKIGFGFIKGYTAETLQADIEEVLMNGNTHRLIGRERMVDIQRDNVRYYYFEEIMEEVK